MNAIPFFMHSTQWKNKITNPKANIRSYFFLFSSLVNYVWLWFYWRVFRVYLVNNRRNKKRRNKGRYTGARAFLIFRTMFWCRMRHGNKSKWTCPKIKGKQHFLLMHISFRVTFNCFSTKTVPSKREMLNEVKVCVTLLSHVSVKKLS